MSSSRTPDADVADALRVVLELACVGPVPLELARHEDVVEAAEGNAGVLPHLERLRTVDPADRRPEALRVVRCAQLGRRLHGDAGLGALDAGDPRRRPGDPPFSTSSGYSPRCQTLPWLSCAKSASSRSTSVPSL